ncbi:MAG: four helix bundle protein [Patescibacteria group bacterium]|nr:four helix bundle protein [Patescibacteria group bacterium]
MKNHELPLFTATYKLYDALYETCKKMPKPDRFNLGSKLEIHCLDALENIILAENSNDVEKIILLRKAHAKIEVLKVFLRLAENKQVITTKDYLKSEEEIQKIGKMLGGWIRYLKNK